MSRPLVAALALVTGLSTFVGGPVAAMTSPDDTRASMDHTQGTSVAPLVVGGQIATTNPGAVSLSYPDRPGAHRCTGALISPDWVLTAEHCIFSTGKPDIRLGSLKSAEGGQTRKTVKAITTGEKFDLALLKLDRPVTDVAPVKLAETCVQKNDVVTVWGWGKTGTDAAAKPSPDLKFVDGTVVDPDNVHPNHVIRGRAIYLQGKKGNFPYSGDSGGPGFLNGQLVGIASRADQVTAEFWYTSVFVYRKWIKDNTGV